MREVRAKRQSIYGLCAAILLALSPNLVRAQTELVVAVPGGSYEEVWRKAVIAPLEVAHPDIKVRTVQGLTFQNLATLRAQKDNVKVDVLLMDEVASSQAASEGLCEPVTVQTLPHLADIYPEFRVPGDPYAKFGFSTAVIAYDPRKEQSPPVSYNVLWDPQYKGRIAIPNLDTNTGVMFFLALNQLKGGTLDNPDPGLTAMKQLKPDVVAFVAQHAQMSQLFTGGDVVLAPWVSDRVTGLQKAGVPIAWAIPRDGGIITEGALVIAKGTQHLREALLYVDAALSPEAQAANAANTYISPVNAKTVLDPEAAKLVPNGPEVIKVVQRPDWKKVGQIIPKWIDRWNREVIQ